MKNLKILASVSFVLFFGCNDELFLNEETEFDLTKVTNPIITNDSFLPMSIGNYWKHDDENFTEITDTLRIQGDLYFKFESIIGGDGYSQHYLRITDNQNLIEVNPDVPDFKILHAKFDIPLNDTFWSLNNQSTNDQKITLIKKEDNLRTYECLNFSFPDVIKYYTSYTRGLGWNHYPGILEINYKQIKIDGVVHNF